MSFESGPPAVPQSAGRSWDEIWIAALTQPSVQTYEDIAEDPSSIPNTAYLWIFVAALFGSAFSAVIGALIRSVFDLASGSGAAYSLGSASFSLLISVCLVPVGAVVSVLILAIWTGVSQLIAVAFGGSGSYSKLIYVNAAFVAPLTFVTQILGAFPILSLISFPLLIYELVLSVIAIKAVNKIGWGQAAVASLALPLVFFICIICLVILAIIGIVAGTT